MPLGSHKGIKKAVQQCWTACTYVYDYRLTVNLLHVSDELEHLVRVTDLVVIPRYNLYECIGKSDTSLSVEDRSASVTKEVRRNHCILSVTQNTLQFALRSFLHSCANLSICSRLSEVYSQVDNRNVESRNTHRHTCQLAVELRNNLTYSLSSTCRRGDDVARSSTTTAPILHRRTVNSLLCSSCRVYSCHQTIGDAELVVQNLSDRSETVSCTRSVRYELSTLNVLVEVYTAYEHWSSVL